MGNLRPDFIVFIKNQSVAIGGQYQSAVGKLLDIVNTLGKQGMVFKMFNQLSFYQLRKAIDIGKPEIAIAIIKNMVRTVFKKVFFFAVFCCVKLEFIFSIRQENYS
ncbi:hypothetical protein D3C85_1382640 [compost metagenome]